MFKKLSLAIIGLFASASVALAAGAFNGYPEVGDLLGTNCLSLGNNSVCNQLSPVGPAAITGNEQIPADTSSSGQPFTVLIPPAALGAGPYQYNAPLTGASLTLTNLQRRLILEPAGTIATLTVTFPAVGTTSNTALVDNQLMGICTTQIVTALTVTAGSGTTILNAPTALLVPVATGAGSCVEWVYRQSNTTWYRVQ